MRRRRKSYSELDRGNLGCLDPKLMAFLIVDAVQNPGPQTIWVSNGVTRKSLTKVSQQHLFEALKSTCEELESLGVRTLCIDIKDESRLYRASEKRDPTFLTSHRIDALASKRDVFFKRFMDVFTDIDDVLNLDPTRCREIVADLGGQGAFYKHVMDPNLNVKSLRSVVKSAPLWNGLVGQRPDQKELFVRLIAGDVRKEAMFGAPTARDYLREAGTQHVVVAGAMAGFCIAQTAMSAAMKGFAVTVLSDRVVGWENMNYIQVKWDQAHPGHHAREVRESLNHIVSDPGSAGYGISERDALIAASRRIVITPSQNFMRRLKMYKKTFAGASSSQRDGTIREAISPPSKPHVGKRILKLEPWT